jgi:catechol 2,3-dioxygenase-like lactoylglutathione lyase family enzyme
MITGLNHITFSVYDLKRSLNFYVNLLGLKPVARWYKGAYLTAGNLWITLILDEQTRRTPLKEYSHIAFSVDKDRFESMRRKLMENGVEKWQDNHSEGDSFYFFDPDGHKLEIHVTGLHNRLTAMKKNPPEDLVFYNQNDDS